MDESGLVELVAISEMPSRGPVSSYGGRLGTDSWRTTADNRIQQNSNVGTSPSKFASAMDRD